MTTNIMTCSAPATEVTANERFLNFMAGGEASYLLDNVACSVELFGTVDDVVETISDAGSALDAYEEQLFFLEEALEAATSVLERYIDCSGFRADMRVAARMVIDGAPNGWNDVLTSAHNCHRSDRVVPNETRKILRKLGVKGMTYRWVNYHMQGVYRAHMIDKRSASRGPLISEGMISGETFEVRGDTHPVLHVYRKVDGQYIEKSRHLDGMDAMSLAVQLFADLSVAA
ncbi:hypothetical protein [Devosia beringensis]|uniref:hypothetical protein n=1 Tax=Devosia beringensis TaxID=2657486 RepID=UPI00186B590A|nr:hypothetical protein [Devosia beringensis]